MTDFLVPHIFRTQKNCTVHQLQSRQYEGFVRPFFLLIPYFGYNLKRKLPGIEELSYLGSHDTKSTKFLSGTTGAIIYLLNLLISKSKTNTDLCMQKLKSSNYYTDYQINPILMRDQLIHNSQNGQSTARQT